MKIYTNRRTISGSPLDGINPLPLFRDTNRDRHPEQDGTLLPEHLEKLGYEAGFRQLPYQSQDRYSRKHTDMTIKTIFIENEFLKAEFWPEYGGRLYSLYDKKKQKEILFTNPVFQPGNLAIRNAWFSGGIEWNIGHLGHSCTTCDSVFFGMVKDTCGNDFLRMYELERMHKLLWAIDFHLPDDSPCLFAHIHIINPNETSVPMYWWTNIAAIEEEQSRVFSNTDEVIFLHPWVVSSGTPKGFGYGKVPNIASLEGTDCTYSLNFPFSSEYFFQNSSKLTSPYEAILYKDGSGFFERSTQPLRIRKLFCWGNHAGGRHWADFLSLSGQGAYVEIQAGLCPTQLNRISMEGNSTLSFTQAFGAFEQKNYAPLEADWKKQGAQIEQTLNEQLDEESIMHYHENFSKAVSIPCHKILHYGSGYGALEEIKRSMEGRSAFPSTFTFPSDSITPEQHLWKSLLIKESIPSLTIKELPLSYITDPSWTPYLLSALEKDSENIQLMLLLGILYYENGMHEEATALWIKAANKTNHPLAYRNLAYSAKEEKDLPKAISYMARCFAVEKGQIDQAFAIEYLEILLDASSFTEAWQLYQSLPDSLKEIDRILVYAAKAAVELQEFSFLETNVFSHTFSTIREGELTLSDVWFQYKARLLAKERNISYEPPLLQEVYRTLNPPRNIDFRLS